MAEAPNNSNPSGNEGGTGTPPATPPATPPTGGESFNPENLNQDQINQILEKNPLIWKTERIAELREKSGKYDKAVADKEAADKKAMEEKGQFKELSEKQAAEIEALNGTIRDNTITSALTVKLVPLGVVDLEGALKLVDRSKITVGDDGTLTGVDEAIESLKTDKSYLFTGQPQPKVGNPTNPGNGNGNTEPMKFKASQLRGPEGAKFYQEHREEILKAQAAGLIERD